MLFYDTDPVWKTAFQNTHKHTQTYPQQDHFGRVFEDLCERVGVRLLGRVRWLDGNIDRSGFFFFFLLKRIFTGSWWAGWSNWSFIALYWAWFNTSDKWNNKADLLFKSHLARHILPLLLLCSTRCWENTLKGSLKCSTIVNIAGNWLSSRGINVLPKGTLKMYTCTYTVYIRSVVPKLVIRGHKCSSWGTWRSGFYYHMRTVRELLRVT